MTNEEKRNRFISKAKKIEGNECIDYSEVVYISNRTPVKLIDHSLRPDGTEYGEFWQIPYNHLRGQGHPDKRTIKASKKRRSKQEDVIRRFKEVHKDEDLDYSQVVYVNMHTKVKIISNELDENGQPLGEFWQEPISHLKGHTHPRYRAKSKMDSVRLSKEKFIQKMQENANNKKYSYNKVNYVNNSTKVCITCNKIGFNGKPHGDFYATPQNLLKGRGCPKCANLTSQAEIEINEFIKQYTKTVQHEHKILEGKEIDIYIPSLKIGIEYNGLFWHSERNGGKTRSYHLNKLEACKKRGVRLLQIFEDEYMDNKDIVINKIKHILNIGTEKPKIMGRKCTIREINKNDADIFLNRNHIQGTTGSSIRLGAFYKDELISVMLFKKNNDRDTEWELSRFASNYDYICQGIGGKMFKYFVRKYLPLSIKSFADRRWTINEDNNLYTQLGFRFDSYVPPSYTYYHPKERVKRFHKFGFRKQILHKKYGLPLTMTETEMAKSLGYDRIWDCGLIKYVWNHS